MNPDNNTGPGLNLPDLDPQLTQDQPASKPADSSVAPVEVPLQVSGTTVNPGLLATTEAQGQVDAGQAEDSVIKTAIERARAIMAGTAGDPYNRAEQLSELKASYIKQRYGQDIKLAQN